MIYPHYSWDPKRFARLSPGYWNDLTNQRNYIESLSRELSIRLHSLDGNVGIYQRYQRLELCDKSNVTGQQRKYSAKHLQWISESR
jgi:hypothetical protein